MMTDMPKPDQMNSVEVDPEQLRQEVIDHPLRVGNDPIFTPPIQELYLAINQFLLTGVPSACFTAPSGVGKSTAMKKAAEMLQNAYPKLLIIGHNVKTKSTPTSQEFFVSLLQTMKHKSLKGNIGSLSARVTTFMIDCARAKGASNVVLFLDEAQALTINDYRFLKDVYNELETNKIKQTTFMMAQEPEFSTNRAAMNLDAFTDLTARFTMHTREFRPASTHEDLRTILEGIDTKTYSGRTWTAFYLPKAVAGGFLLSSQTKAVMDELRRIAPRDAEFLGFPSRQLFATIIIFFMAMSVYDAADFTPPAGAWRQAMKNSNMEVAIAKLHSDYELRSPIILK